ncbi:trypsin-like [Belonocnema kinseyi]|uniref:trypsin-like n=1 Tax=Belonocnema kinseyi TaxID=2817044 RepID=UPI00143DE4BC|nr:trypsin-like [Belonocnema kinseyi]
MKQLPLNLLILCAVISQVMSVLSEKLSSNLHVRKKRLINTTPLHIVSIDKKYLHYDHSNYQHDLALLYVIPPIDLVRRFNRKIDFYGGPLHPNTPVTLSGWGCTNIEGPYIFHNAHKRVNPNNDENLCISDKLKKQGNCYSDTRGPVVIDGKLAGILSWPPRANKPLPEIAINLAHAAYRE